MVTLRQTRQVKPCLGEVDALVGYGVGWRLGYSLIQDDERNEESQVYDACPYCDLYRPKGQWIRH